MRCAGRRTLPAGARRRPCPRPCTRPNARRDPPHSLRTPHRSGKGSGITLTPFAAGHQLGGAVWRVRKAGDDYVYAVDYNHR